VIFHRRCALCERIRLLSSFSESNETVSRAFNACLVPLVEELSTPHGGVAALGNFAGVVAFLPKKKTTGWLSVRWRR
jgi:hypothetical protein